MGQGSRRWAFDPGKPQDPGKVRPPTLSAKPKLRVAAVQASRGTRLVRGLEFCLGTGTGLTLMLLRQYRCACMIVYDNWQHTEKFV